MVDLLHIQGTLPADYCVKWFNPPICGRTSSRAQCGICVDLSSLRDYSVQELADLIPVGSSGVP
jgi:hypothetical protein